MVTTQIKVLGIAEKGQENTLASLVDTEQINCLTTLSPDECNIEKAVSMPIDAMVLLSSRFDDAEVFFMKAYQSARNGVAVILVLSCTITVEIMQRAMECGINGVISVSDGKDAVCALIEKETEKLSSRTVSADVRKFDSKVLVSFSSKGGSGKTAVACNLASTLSKCGKQVTIIDLNLSSGDVRSCFNITSGETMAELAEEPSLTPSIIKKYVLPSDFGVSVISAPSVPQRSRVIYPDIIAQIITTLRTVNDYVIIDCGQQLDGGPIAKCTEKALEEADMILYIINPEVPTITGASIVLQKYLSKQTGMIGKTKILINKSGGDSPLTSAEISSAIGYPIFAEIPYDYKTIVNSANSGVPFMSSVSLETHDFLKKKLQKAFESLGKKVME